MKSLGIYSKNKIYKTFDQWNVPKEFAETMYNYLIHGLHPGGCFTAVLANDFNGAMMSSHPSNSIGAYKNLASWIIDVIPQELRGDYSKVSNWTNKTEEMRFDFLIQRGIIYSPEEEMIMTLRGDISVTPVLF